MTTREMILAYLTDAGGRTAPIKALWCHILIDMKRSKAEFETAMAELAAEGRFGDDFDEQCSVVTLK